MLLEIGKFYKTRVDGIAKVTSYGGYWGKFSATLENGEIIELFSDGLVNVNEVNDGDLVEELNQFP